MQANIRGGGEYGPRWHQAALKEKRHKAYEDFEAVAQDLVARGVTSPRKLGCQGGSNGGLLTGNMLAREGRALFGAIVCQVPLLDMRRYHKLLAGASWMGEYGDPDTEDWDFLQKLLALPQRASPTRLPAHPLHHLDPRRPRAPGPRAQDGEQAAGHGQERPPTTTRTSRAATAARPTTSSAPS